MKIQYIYNILLAALIGGMSSCADIEDIVPVDADEAGIAVGDEVLFSARVPQPSTSRSSAAEDAYNALMNGFRPVDEDYTFTVEMHEQGIGKIAQGEYNPMRQTVDEVVTFDEHGTLSDIQNALYWQSNVKRYGFYAYAGNQSLETDQSTDEKLFAQDRIEGYGYVRGWDVNLGASRLSLDAMNYLTSKDWYAYNKQYEKESGGMSTDVDFLKKIPLYMHHKRSRITVLLKAGEGIEREQLRYDEHAADNIITEIYGYDGSGNQTVIHPLLSSYSCDYTPGVVSDPENTIESVRYDAIVDPYDYATGSNVTDKKILSVNLSNLKFSFFAANDEAYGAYIREQNASYLDDVRARYNLEEGKHLILEVTLSTDTRKILITAYVVDWEEWSFSTICDDFGQSGNPIPINTKAELIDFLTTNSKNKAGNVGVIVPSLLDLTVDGGWNFTGCENVSLNATLKLAGATIKTDKRLFKTISETGSLVNGTIVIKDKGGDEEIDCAIAQDNYGTIDRVGVTGSETVRKASSAGLVTTNYGTISRCSSVLGVYSGNAEFVGGIAARQQYPRDSNGVVDASRLPVIDQCFVNARVDGTGGVSGGGIVGFAEGQISNNTYEYGITMSQSVDKFKNILHTKGSQDLKCFSNEWSTRDENSVVGGSNVVNARNADLYIKVIDSQTELYSLLNSTTYNTKDARYRIADSFVVDDTWALGIKSDDLTTANKGNVYCEINGNGKMITLTGGESARMLFSNVMGDVYDMTIYCEKKLESAPDQDGLSAIAPLAYSVTVTSSGSGKLRGIKVKMKDGEYVKASSPAGLVVWAYNGAVIEDCESNADVRIYLPAGSGTQASYFVGGIVCNASTAKIERCVYHRQALDVSQQSMTTNVYYGGIVGGTEGKSQTVDPSPNLLISDCTSWLSWTSTQSSPHSSWGGIIGYAKSSTSGTGLGNGMSSECQGNWWNAPYGASQNGLPTGVSEEKAIGKKNSIDPVQDVNYNNI